MFEGGHNNGRVKQKIRVEERKEEKIVATNLELTQYNI